MLVASAKNRLQLRCWVMRHWPRPNEFPSMLVAGMWKVRNLRENLWNWKNLRLTPCFFLNEALWNIKYSPYELVFAGFLPSTESELKPKIYKFAHTHTHTLESKIWNFFIGFSGCADFVGLPMTFPWLLNLSKAWYPHPWPVAARETCSCSLWMDDPLTHRSVSPSSSTTLGWSQGKGNLCGNALVICMFFFNLQTIFFWIPKYVYLCFGFEIL